jgi:hypothetical protein
MGQKTVIHAIAATGIHFQSRLPVIVVSNVRMTFVSVNPALS